MATDKLTEYELKRLENIKRNQEKMAALMIKSKASELSAAAKRPRTAFKSYEVLPESKQTKTQTSIVLRRSLRTRGMPPDSKALADDFLEDSISKREKSLSPMKPFSVSLGPVSISDVYVGKGCDKQLIDVISGLAKTSKSGVAALDEKKLGDFQVQDTPKRDAKESERRDSIDASLSGDPIPRECSCLSVPSQKPGLKLGSDLGSMVLEPENVARVVPGKTRSVKFFPCSHAKMIAAGDNFGNLGFWNMDHREVDGDGIYLYHPHDGPVSEIVVQNDSLSKVLTSCYDGFIRLMDAEKEIFYPVYSSDDAIFSLSQQEHDVNNLYFGEGNGRLIIWDLRSGNHSAKWDLHEARINTIDFSTQNQNTMATSSSDATVCLWDLRRMGGAKKPTTLKVVSHKRAVHSAYFSPSGCALATTSVAEKDILYSFDDRVGILSGANYEDISMIYHYNQTGRWIPSFKAIWGWDDSCIFIGNMKRYVDVISPVQRAVVTSFHSPHMSSIACRFNAHPQIVGLLAGATAGGKVFVWTSP